MKTLDRIARYTSIVLVPPSLSAIVFAVYVIAYQHGSVIHQALVWFIATAFSGGLLILYVLNMRKQRQVTDYDVPEQEQRTKPFLIGAGLQVVGLLALMFMNASIFILALMAVLVINTLLLTLINRFWKISAHMLGMGGAAPALLPVMGSYAVIVLPFALLLGWARVRAQVHTPSQVIAGAIAGFILTWVQLFAIFTYVVSM